MRLGARDLRTVLSCAGELARVDSTGALPSHVLRLVPQLVPCDLAIYNEMDLRNGHSVALGDPSEPVEDRNEAWEPLMAQHPVVAYWNRAADSQSLARVLKISDFLDRRAFHRLELYQEVYRPIDVEDQLAVTLHVMPGFIVGISANRRRSDFSERDRAMFEAMRPFLLYAYRRAVARAAARASIRALEQGLAGANLGLVELDENGQIMYATPAGAELLTRYLGRRPSLAVESRVIQGAGGALLLQPIDDRALLLEERRDPFAGRGLTAREREVVARAAGGEANRELAEDLVISTRTVEKHLEHAYAKLGVHGRREAAQLLVNRPWV